MGILKKEFKNLLNKEIVVVMNDGRAFKGALIKFDKDVVVLRNVLEAKAENPVWKESTASTRILGKQEVKGTIIGDTDVVKLDEVILRIEMVSRIWKWIPQKPAGH
jgi:small nuclear ribonucleoprotein (snRNP)-like protein